MTLKLYFHPLSSFCQKVLIALYENATPFEPVMVNLGEEASRAAFLKTWPIGIPCDSIAWFVLYTSIAIAAYRTRSRSSSMSRGIYAAASECSSARVP